MSPILVPTLAELAIELGKAMAEENRLAMNPVTETEEAALYAASARVSDICGQIIAIPVASLADLQTKAMAMDWHNRAILGRSYDGQWELLCAQLAEGLLALQCEAPLTDLKGEAL